MGSRRYKDSAEGQGVSCHRNGEIAGQDGDDGRQGMETGHGDRGGTGMTGDRAWRQGMETGDRGRAWRLGTVIRKGLRVRRLAGGRCR